MLKLNIQKDPYWITLPANVKVKVKPLGSAVMNLAQHQTIQHLIEMQKDRKQRLAGGEDVSNFPDMENHAVRSSFSETLLTRALATIAIVEWEGVMQSEKDEPAELNEQNILQLMDIWYVADSFWKQYTKSVEILESEGNASGLAANGISAAGQNTAASA